MRIQDSGPRLVTNASSLLAATVATSGLGLVYWVVAARLYDPEQLGVGSALISGASLLAGFAQLSLGLLFVRYLPTAGAHAGKVVARSLALASSLALVLAIGYLLMGGGSQFIPNAWTAALFIVAVPVLAVFALQDFALLALGAAPLVAYQNGAFSLVKLLLLPVLIGLSISGIFLSWVVTATLAVVVILFMIFARLVQGLPRDMAKPLPSGREIVHELWVQYLSQTTGYLTTFALPLVVVARLGTEQAGYFALPWMIGNTFVLLNHNALAALQVHSTSGHRITPSELRRTGVLLGLISGLGAVVCAVLAPWVLQFAAPGYGGADPVQLLRLMCLAAPFQAVWLLLGTTLWIAQRMAFLIAIQSAYVCVLLGVSWCLAPQVGIASVGWGFLIAGAAGAMLGAPTLVSMLRKIVVKPSTLPTS